MADVVRHCCPLCDWRWETNRPKTIAHKAAIEFALRDHLDEAHEGWTLNSLIVTKDLQATVVQQQN